jgi:hypothetical protein
MDDHPGRQSVSCRALRTANHLRLESSARRWCEFRPRTALPHDVASLLILFSMPPPCVTLRTCCFAAGTHCDIQFSGFDI